MHPYSGALPRLPRPPEKEEGKLCVFLRAAGHSVRARGRPLPHGLGQGFRLNLIPCVIMHAGQTTVCVRGDAPCLMVWGKGQSAQLAATIGIQVGIAAYICGPACAVEVLVEVRPAKPYLEPKPGCCHALHAPGPSWVC